MSAAIRWTPEELERYRARRRAESGRECPEQPKAKSVKPPRAESPLEIEFARQLADAGIEMEREHRPIPGRKFRLDFADVAAKIGVEIQGRVHRVESKWLADQEKLNLLQINGWAVLHVCREHIFEGKALDWLKQLRVTG